MSISVIIPTLNEAATIEKLVLFITEQGNQVADIIVVDGGSTDDTCEVASSAGARVIATGIQSRAAQMNSGAAVARGNILFFVHADVVLPQNFCGDIISAYRSGYQGGCYRLRFASQHLLLKLNAFCTRYDGIMCRGGDQTLFISKNLFSDLNGFDEYYTIMEDYDLITRMRIHAKFKIIPKDVIVSARKYKSNSWLTVQIVNASAFFLYFLKIHPTRIKRFYQKALQYKP